MGISKFQLQLLQKIPREPKSPLTTNELADALFNANERGVSKASLRKRIINNINQLGEIFPGALVVNKDEKDHRYCLSAKAPLLLTPMSQEEMIAFGILSHFGTDLLPDRTLEALAPYFQEAKESAYQWARETGHGVKASKELAGNWLKKIAVVPAVMPFTPPEVIRLLRLNTKTIAITVLTLAAASGTWAQAPQKLSLSELENMMFSQSPALRGAASATAAAAAAVETARTVPNPQIEVMNGTRFQRPGNTTPNGNLKSLSITQDLDMPWHR